MQRGRAKKKLYYLFSNGKDEFNILMELSGCMKWIKEDMNETDEGEDREFTIKPIWLTAKEYKNITEV